MEAIKFKMPGVFVTYRNHKIQDVIGSIGSLFTVKNDVVITYYRTPSCQETLGTSEKSHQILRRQKERSRLEKFKHVFIIYILSCILNTRDVSFDSKHVSWSFPLAYYNEKIDIIWTNILRGVVNRFIGSWIIQVFKVNIIWTTILEGVANKFVKRWSHLPIAYLVFKTSRKMSEYLY